MIPVVLYIAILLVGALLAYRALRKPKPTGTTYVIAWWNGCTMELPPGIHAANAVVYCCSVQPRARA